jgi:hypothetical protein
MPPDASSPTPHCAQCGSNATLDATYCLVCGQLLLSQSERRGLAPVRIVEADAPVALRAQAQAAETALAAQGEQGERPGALAARLATVATLATLATAAWRQPAVRSVVTTGASAVALSLVWRVAGAALSGGKARRALLPTLAEGESLAPMVGELLRGATPSKRLRRRGRRGEVIEEVVYIRRVFRR